MIKNDGRLQKEESCGGPNPLPGFFKKVHTNFQLKQQQNDKKQTVYFGHVLGADFEQ